MRATPKSRWRWFWRISTIVLLLDIAIWMDHSHRSVLNLWGHLNVGRPGTGPHPIHPSATVFRTLTGVRVVPDYEVDHVALDASTTEIASAYAFPRIRVYGVLAPFVTSVKLDFFISPLPGQALTPGELAIIESGYASILIRSESEHLHAWGQQLASGVNPKTSISTPWLVHDVVIGLLATVLTIQAVRWGLIVRTESRAANRLRRGQCPCCTYDLGSLRGTSTNTCPECGTPIPPIDARLPIG